MCKEHCRNLGYNLAGAGCCGGRVCRCGDGSPAAGDAAAESKCSDDCPGRQGEKCGGGVGHGEWFMNIFRLDTPGKSNLKKTLLP